MIKSKGYAAHKSGDPLAPFQFERREPTDTDVQIEILYCGICHSDLHTVRAEWAGTVFPCVPGHEIIGKVVKFGAKVTNFKLGETVGVGCMVDSCRTCPDCRDGLEQYCHKGATFTYNSPDKHTGKVTYGGYSDKLVVDQDFVLHVSDKLDPAGAAPLLCAGITTYSPLKHWKVGKGTKVGIVGLGGLGHMGVKLAKAFGAEVVLFTTSPNKVADAKRLGASEVVISTDQDQMQRYNRSLDFILNTVAMPHNLDAYTALLKRDGTLCLVGLPKDLHPSPSVWNLIGARRSIAGSVIGGIKETQEMLNFCAEHKITSDIELIQAPQINQAYERMLKSDVKYRFVVDAASF